MTQSTGPQALGFRPFCRQFAQFAYFLMSIKMVRPVKASLAVRAAIFDWSPSSATCLFHHGLARILLTEYTNWAGFRLTALWLSSFRFMLSPNLVHPTRFVVLVEAVAKVESPVTVFAGEGGRSFVATALTMNK